MIFDTVQNLEDQSLDSMRQLSEALADSPKSLASVLNRQAGFTMGFASAMGWELSYNWTVKSSEYIEKIR